MSGTGYFHAIDPVLDYKAGLVIVLFVWTITECLLNESAEKKVWNDPTFSIFMSIGSLLFSFWLWGFSIYIWKKYDIEFVYLLDLDATKLGELSHPDFLIFSHASNYTIVYLLAFIAYTRTIREVIITHSTLTYAHSIPLLLIGILIYMIFNPWYIRRKWLIMLRNVFFAPYYPILFRDGYIGDILTSLVRVIIPFCSGLIYILMTIYSYISNDFQYISTDNIPIWEQSTVFSRYFIPFLSLFPLWIRLLQCLRRSIETGDSWPHHANAIKYFSTIVVISYGIFQPTLRTNMLWFTAFIITTLYQYIWDICMDWGLLVFYQPPRQNVWTQNLWTTCIPFNIRFRSTLLLQPTWVYIFMIVFNFFFRFAWMLTIWPYDGESYHKSNNHILHILFNHSGPFVASAEILRRMLWGILRVEYEYIVTYGEAHTTTATIKDKEVTYKPSHHDKSNDENTDISIKVESTNDLSSYSSQISNPKLKTVKSNDKHAPLNSTSSTSQSKHHTILSHHSSSSSSSSSRIRSTSIIDTILHEDYDGDDDDDDNHLKNDDMKGDKKNRMTVTSSSRKGDRIKLHVDLDEESNRHNNDDDDEDNNCISNILKSSTFIPSNSNNVTQEDNVDDDDDDDDEENIRQSTEMNIHDGNSDIKIQSRKRLKAKKEDGSNDIIDMSMKLDKLEKMDMKTSVATGSSWFDLSRPLTSFTLSNGLNSTLNASGNTITWRILDIVDILLIPDFIVKTMEFIQLDILQSSRHKARFIESVVFVLLILTVILIASSHT